MVQKKSLGKGLGAILSDSIAELGTRPTFMLCGIEELSPNRFQPRHTFDDNDQKQLVASIKKSGIIQPLVVRKTEKGYEIIAGERRWRAAQAAGLHDVPILVREAEDQDLAELSLIENIQREELNAVEEANAYQTLMEKFGLSQEDISQRVGKDRSTIANTVRLLKLPGEIKTALIKKAITPGHGRALLALETPDEQVTLFRAVVKKGLNVRDTERLIQQLKKTSPSKKPAAHDPYLQDLEKKLSLQMMARVKINYGNKKKGTIEINFSGNEELNRLLEMLLTGA